MMEIERLAQPTNPEEEEKLEMLEEMLNSDSFAELLKKIMKESKDND